MSLKNIPKDWQLKKLKDVADFSNGKGHEQSIDECGKYIVINSKFISTDGRVKKYSTQNLSPLNFGDITMVMSDIPNGKAIAKCFIIDEDDRYTLNQRICSIKSNENCNNKFLYYVINRNSYYLAFDNGVSQTNLRKEEVLDCPVQLPPLPEQQKIAEILSTVDAKIEVIDQQITETQALKKGMMQRLLTKGIGHTEFKESALGEIPKSWEVVKIGDVLKLGSGKDYKHLGVGTIPVFGTGGIMTYVDNYLFDGESVGIGRKGTIDKPVLLKDKFWTVDTLFYTHSFNNITPYFVYIVFQSIKWRGYSEATGVPSLSKNIIEPINIPLPTLDEQDKISNIFISIDSKLEVLSEKKTHYKELKQGLMQQLLTGKIRVKTNHTIRV